MKLSVIIVNYNVKIFLEQCLHSVYNSIKNIDSEIVVVDNNSSDDSIQMLIEKFPNVKRIENKINKGFSAANNQAIKIAGGQYVLLLNPDTILESDTIEKTIAFMETHPDAGALGVKMLDGAGNFLPESKRGLPTPAVAFYRIFGLSKLFPKSKIFNLYNLGFLDENKTHQVDILAGAFMLIKKSVFETVGFFDEAFFMYGEDIDLSYRILLAGYKNYYFSETKIIHFKGKSTNKNSFEYVNTFYKAMLIFSKKHFFSKNKLLFLFFIYPAIYLRIVIASIPLLFKRT